MQGLPDNVRDALSSNKVVVFSKSYCPYCKGAKQQLTSMGVPYTAYECDIIPITQSQTEQLHQISGIRTFPKIFIGETIVGGFDSLKAKTASGEVYKLLEKAGIPFTKQMTAHDL